MKAKDLAKKLLEHPEAEVVVQSDDPMEVNSNVSVGGITLYKNAQKKQKQIVDTFERTTYNKNVWYFIDGNKKVIKINGS